MATIIVPRVFGGTLVLGAAAPQTVVIVSGRDGNAIVLGRDGKAVATGRDGSTVVRGR